MYYIFDYFERSIEMIDYNIMIDTHSPIFLFPNWSINPLINNCFTQWFTNKTTV